ncbi:hypothetical protein [Deinococcus ruber]|nr:hypothetical protein [Deinococcus ruber]
MRDILFAYVEMVDKWKGFGHDVLTGSFDPYKYIDVESEIEDENMLTLLRAGSAIVLLCGIYNLWNESEDINHPFAFRLRDAVMAKRLWRFPDIEDVILGVFERKLRWDDLWLYENLPAIYERYVADYFEQLSKRR